MISTSNLLIDVDNNSLGNLGGVIEDRDFKKAFQAHVNSESKTVQFFILPLYE